MTRLPQNQQQWFTQWTWLQERAFEEAIAIFPDNMPEAERWQRVATHVPGKTPTKIKEHYHALLHHHLCQVELGRVEPDNMPEYSQRVATHVLDKILTEINEHYHTLLHHLCQVESGWVEFPNYSDDSAPAKVEVDDNSSTRTIPVQRKKRLTWTDKEHRLFLIGLEKYGKGDWKSISRNVVKSKTATQIASHVQKYFIRQGFPKKERKRTTIHDISIEGIGNEILKNLVYAPNIPLHQLEEPQNWVLNIPMQQNQ